LGNISRNRTSKRGQKDGKKVNRGRGEKGQKSHFSKRPRTDIQRAAGERYDIKKKLRRVCISNSRAHTGNHRKSSKRKKKADASGGATVLHIKLKTPAQADTDEKMKAMEGEGSGAKWRQQTTSRERKWDSEPIRGGGQQSLRIPG